MIDQDMTDDQLAAAVRPFTRDTVHTIERWAKYRLMPAWNATQPDYNRLRDPCTVMDVRVSREASTGLEVKVNPIGTTANIWIDAGWLAEPVEEQKASA